MKSKKGIIFVLIQVLLFLIYVIPVQIIWIPLPRWLRYLGLIILILGFVLGLVALLQLNTKLSPFPAPVAHGKLITSGAYNIARHPIYTAVIALGLGYALYQASWFKVMVSVLLLILLYYKSQYEETLLMETYAEYATYKKKTRRFI